MNHFFYMILTIVGISLKGTEDVNIEDDLALLQSQPIQDALVFNLLDHGGDNAGMADNSGLINQLIDSLYKQGGGILYLPDGDYRIDTAIILKSSVALWGESLNSTIFRSPLDGNWTSSPHQGLITTSRQGKNIDIEIKNISVNGNYKKNEIRAKAGIALRNCQNCKVSQVNTFNTWHGIAFYDNDDSLSNNLIENCKVVNAHANTTKNNQGRPRGILVNDSGAKVVSSQSFASGTGFYANGENIQFIDCYAEGWFNDNGFYLIVKNLKVKSCVAKAAESVSAGFGSGFAIAYREDALVEDCIAINCSNYGFRIHVPQSNSTFRNNKAIGCGIGFGIETASFPYPNVSKNLVFYDNESKESGLYGFLFRQMEDSSVERNTAIDNNQRGITRSTRGGIALKEHVDNNVFTGNVCVDTQEKPTQIYGLYDYSVEIIKNPVQKGENIIIHRSTTGTDLFK